LTVPYTASPWQGTPSAPQAIVTWDGSAKPAKHGCPIAGCGIVLFVESGLLGRRVLGQWAVPLPYAHDAQQAEAWGSRFAVKMALQAPQICLAHSHKIVRVILRGDSGCLAGAFNGKFRLRTPGLVDITMPLHNWLSGASVPVIIEHWDRSFNSEADKLADLGAGLLDHLVIGGGRVRYNVPTGRSGTIVALPPGVTMSDEACLANNRSAGRLCNIKCSFSIPPHSPHVLPFNPAWHALCCEHTASLLSSDRIFPMGPAGFGRLVTFAWETGLYSDRVISWIQAVPGWTASRRAKWLRHIIQHNSCWAERHPLAKRAVCYHATVIGGDGRVYGLECNHLTAGMHLRSLCCFQHCFMLDMPAAHLQIFVAFCSAPCPTLRHYLREKKRWRLELARGFNCSLVMAKKLFTLLLCGSLDTFKAEAGKAGVTFLPPPLHDPLRNNRFQGLFNRELDGNGVPLAIIAMFSEVRSNRAFVTQQLKDRHLFVNRPSAATSPIRSMAACLEAAEGCIFAVLARWLFQRHQCAVECYAHDAVIIPNTVSCNVVLALFREATLRVLGTQLVIDVVDWQPLLQEATQLCPLALPHHLSLLCAAPDSCAARPTMRRVRRNTGKRRHHPTSARRRSAALA